MSVDKLYFNVHHTETTICGKYMTPSYFLQGLQGEPFSPHKGPASSQAVGVVGSKTAGLLVCSLVYNINYIPRLLANELIYL